jgi:hypothetical protein
LGIKKGVGIEVDAAKAILLVVCKNMRPCKDLCLQRKQYSMHFSYSLCQCNLVLTGANIGVANAALKTFTDFLLLLINFAANPIANLFYKLEIYINLINQYKTHKIFHQSMVLFIMAFDCEFRWEFGKFTFFAFKW